MLNLPQSPVIRSPEMENWREILVNWQCCWARAAQWAGHPLLSKKEILNTGILVGAAWQTGFIAFQEMTRKKYQSDNDEYDNYNDLYVCLENHPENHEFSDYIECKGGWVKNVEKAKKLLKEAVADAERLDTEDNYSRLIGMAFCNFWFTKDKLPSVDDEIEKLYSQIAGIDCDVIAWSFPEGLRNYIDGPNLIPGVVLLAKLTRNQM